MRRRKTLVFLAAAIFAGSSSGVVSADDGLRGADRLDADVRAASGRGDAAVSVIVHLEAPEGAMAMLSPNSTDGDLRRSQAMEPLIGDVVGRLIDGAAPADVARIRPFKLQPAFAAVVTPTGLDRILADPAVRFVEPDRRYSVHTQEGLEMIGASDLHALGFSGSGTAIAIIDTGIDYHHPTLGGAAIPNAKVVRGLDTADLDDDPMDCNAHGTAVASVAAGTSYQWNPQRRFAGGVAPQARILAYKASPDSDCGGFRQSAVIAAIEDALLHRIGDGYELAAINLSLGSDAFEGPCDGLAPSWASAVAAATQAGVAVVASAGNEGLATALSAPACLSEVVSVGSVWDTEPGLVGFSFCLDPDCSEVCNDSYQPAGSVTCYSNSGSLLDLFAPSEYLRAARAGDETGEFGGTSGAAAYVSGALALVRQAAPLLSPGQARRLLQLTGVPTLDRRSGLVRPRIHLGQALESAASVLQSPDPALPIPDVADVSAVSTLQVARVGAIGSVRVLLNLAHPDPTELRVVLRSPDGTAVRLHDRTAGTVAGDGNTPAASPAVWGLYPDDLCPVDSLGIFSGREMHGTWTLEVFDEMPGDGGAAVATLVGWALRIEDADPPSGDDSGASTIPVAANAPGIQGTSWVSDLRILNPSHQQSAIGRLYLVPATADGSVEFRQTELVLPPLTVVALPDVVARRFGAPGVRGSLRLDADPSELITTSRIFTVDDGGGSYGQYVGAASPHHATALGEDPLALPHLTDTPWFRTNVGFTEIDGGPVTFELTLFEGEGGGPPVRTIRQIVEPFSNIQFRIGSGVESSNLYALVRVVEGDGRIVGYASMVDNLTGDAVFVPAVRPHLVGEIVLPVVARTTGQASTDWRTELRIANIEDRQVPLVIEFRSRRGDPEQQLVAERIVAPRSVLVVEDVMADLFDQARGVGSLRVIAVGEPAAISATGRVYNSTEDGTYGQFVVASADGVGRLAAVIHADATPATRTNLGVCEVAGGTVTVRATVRDAYGRAIGDALVLDAEPYQLVQVDDVFAAAGQASAANAWIELELVAGDGGFVGYGSMVDALTGDAIFVPAQPLPEPPPTNPYP